MSDTGFDFKAYKKERAIERKAERDAAYPVVLETVVRVLQRARGYEAEAEASVARWQEKDDYWMVDAAKQRLWEAQRYSWMSVGDIRRFVDSYALKYESPKHSMEWPVEYLGHIDQTLMIEKAVRQLVREGKVDHAIGSGAIGTSRQNKSAMNYRWLHEEERES